MAMRKVREGYTLYHKLVPHKGPCEVDLPDDVAKAHAQMLEPLTATAHQAAPPPQAETVKDVHVKAAEPTVSGQEAKVSKKH